jgi:hypothetical protein
MQFIGNKRRTSNLDSQSRIEKRGLTGMNTPTGQWLEHNMLQFRTPDRVYWDTDHLGVTFVVYDGNRAIRCHASRAAIDDHLDYSTPGTILDRARAQIDALATQARSKIMARAFEVDGSIRITTADWR